MPSDALIALFKNQTPGARGTFGLLASGFAQPLFLQVRPPQGELPSLAKLRQTGEEHLLRTSVLQATACLWMWSAEL